MELFFNQFQNHLPNFFSYQQSQFRVVEKWEFDQVSLQKTVPLICNNNKTIPLKHCKYKTICNGNIGLKVIAM